MRWHGETERVSDRLEHPIKAASKQYQQNSTNRGNHGVHGPELSGIHVLVKTPDPTDQIIRNKQAYEGNPHHGGIDPDWCGS